jgi:hypothetical protein
LLTDDVVGFTTGAVVAGLVATGAVGVGVGTEGAGLVTTGVDGVDGAVVVGVLGALGEAFLP